ncbi:hypothetical protein CTT30_22625 (plasmid) [Vibrio coralliilyticus]|nr:hypothetical protein CTT30_22625 [Vibrio coralliilyticus]
MTVLKIVLVVISLLSIRKLGSAKRNKYLVFYLFGIALFMTGMEMITNSATPWSFLFFEAQPSDWNNAALGGVGMLALPVILYGLVGKDIQKLLGARKDDA